METYLTLLLLQHLILPCCSAQDAGAILVHIAHDPISKHTVMLILMLSKLMQYAGNVLESLLLELN